MEAFFPPDLLLGFWTCRLSSIFFTWDLDGVLFVAMMCKHKSKQYIVLIVRKHSGNKVVGKIWKQINWVLLRPQIFGPWGQAQSQIVVDTRLEKVYQAS